MSALSPGELIDLQLCREFPGLLTSEAVAIRQNILALLGVHGFIIVLRDDSEE